LGFDDAAVEYKAHGVGDLGHGSGGVCLKPYSKEAAPCVCGGSPMGGAFFH
jgi:hypothetical protein